MLCCHQVESRWFQLVLTWQTLYPIRAERNLSVSQPLSPVILLGSFCLCLAQLCVLNNYTRIPLTMNGRCGWARDLLCVGECPLIALAKLRDFALFL